jgi:hypothetical protein
LAVYGRELAALRAAGQIVQIGDRLVVPPAHRFVLDGIVGQFLPEPVGAASP